jgi:DUF1365 family protein
VKDVASIMVGVLCIQMVNFHVSPFMTMDHDYDWTFQLSSGRISVLTKMIKREEQSKEDLV